MKVSVHNLSLNNLSTDVGLIGPAETKTLQMGPEAAYRAAEGLKTLVDKGLISVTILEEPQLLDDLEPAAVGTASVADGTVTTAKLASGALSADAAGRAVMADNFFNEATADVKMVDGAVNGGKLKNATVAGGKLSNGAVGTTQLASNAVTHAKLDETVELESAVVTVSTSELLALNTTPKTIVAAPAAGKALIFEGAILFLDYATTPYDGIAAGENLAFKYTDGSGAEVAACETDPFLGSSADAMRYVYPGNTTLGDIIPVEAAPLVLHMLVDNIATGDSPLKVKVYYRVVPTTL